jgi:hypothetical protein
MYKRIICPFFNNMNIVEYFKLLYFYSIVQIHLIYCYNDYISYFNNFLPAEPLKSQIDSMKFEIVPNILQKLCFFIETYSHQTFVDLQ